MWNGYYNTPTPLIKHTSTRTRTTPLIFSFRGSSSTNFVIGKSRLGNANIDCQIYLSSGEQIIRHLNTKPLGCYYSEKVMLLPLGVDVFDPWLPLKPRVQWLWYRNSRLILLHISDNDGTLWTIMILINESWRCNSCNNILYNHRLELLSSRTINHLFYSTRRSLTPSSNVASSN